MLNNIVEKGVSRETFEEVNRPWSYRIESKIRLIRSFRASNLPSLLNFKVGISKTFSLFKNHFQFPQNLNSILLTVVSLAEFVIIQSLSFDFAFAI